MTRSEAPSRPSRGEIETLCILHAVGAAGCPPHDLAARLGLSRSLAPAVAEGMEPLVQEGLLALEGERLSLTEAGAAMLARRVRELGVNV